MSKNDSVYHFYLWQVNKSDKGITHYPQSWMLILRYYVVTFNLNTPSLESVSEDFLS